MSFYQELPYPVFVGTGSVLTSGGTENLKPGQLALVDASTYQAVGTTATAVEHPRLLIAGGSWHTTDSLSKFIGGLKESKKTEDFLVKDVMEFHTSDPTLLTQDIQQIGWDGVNACDSLAFDCGTSYFFKVNVSGEDVFRTFSRPLYRFIELRTNCCPADTNCTQGECDEARDPTFYAKKLAGLINSDVELKYFVRAEAVVSNYAATSANYRAYHINVCDNGDVVALAAVQNAYPTKQVFRYSRSGSTSTYELVDLISNGAPGTFTPTGSVLLAICGACPSGYTAVAAADYYIVRRPIAGSENFAGGTTTFTNTVNSDYGVTGSVFLGQDGAVALVQIKTTAGATVTALKDDVVVFSHSNDAKCTPPAASAIAWTTFEDRYKTTRTQCVTLQRDCGTVGNSLPEMQAYYANDASIVAGSIVISASGTCNDTYQLQQYNDTAVVDGCLSPAATNFPDVPAFNGFQWADCPCASPNPDALPGSPVYAGVRIIGAYADTRFDNCSFEPTDYFSQRPLRIRVSQVDSKGNPCDKGTKVTPVQYGTVATQTGEWLIRQYLKSMSLEAYGAWSSDPRIRQILDQQYLSFIDRTKLYKVYYIVYTQDRFRANFNTMQPNDKFETIVAFETGIDTSTFETVFGGMFSQVGVYLKKRG